MIQDHAEKIYDYETKQNYLGIVSLPDPIKYKKYYKKYYITAGTAFRPDIICFEKWGNQDLVWVLKVINNFTSVKDFKIGISINYLPKKYIENLGLI